VPPQPVAMLQQSEERDGAQGQKGEREDAALIGKARCECREGRAATTADHGGGPGCAPQDKQYGHEEKPAKH
jgi:hypothetical protein